MTSVIMRRFLEGIEEEIRSGNAERAADKIRARLKSPKAPKKVLPGRSIKEAKADKKAAHRERTAAIRSAVMARANGRCEWCKRPANNYNPLVMHHQEGGNGRRRQQQSVANCIAVHVGCHNLIHQGYRA